MDMMYILGILQKMFSNAVTSLDKPKNYVINTMQKII